METLNITEGNVWENEGPGGPGNQSADEIYADDGRDAGPASEHGGDWGSHESGDNVSDVDFDEGVQSAWDAAIDSW